MIQVTNNLGELLLGLLVKVADSNASGEDSIVGVCDCHISGGFCCLLNPLEGDYPQIHVVIQLTKLSSSTVVTPWYTPDMTFCVMVAASTCSLSRP